MKGGVALKLNAGMIFNYVQILGWIFTLSKFNVIIIVKKHTKVVFGKLVVQKKLFLVYFSFRLVIDSKLKTVDLLDN